MAATGKTPILLYGSTTPTFVPLVPGDNSDEYGPEGNVLYPLLS